MQTQTSNAIHNAIIEAGGKDHPPMLAPGNYNPPYKFKWIEKTALVAEGSSETTTKGYMENYKNVSQDIRDQLDAKAEKAIKELKQGESINVQYLKTNLYWEFEKFTSRYDESLEPYYSRGTGYDIQRIANVVGARENVEVSPNTADNSGPIFDAEPLHELIEIIIFIIDSGCSKHMNENLKILTNFVEKFLGTVKFENDQIASILGYGDLIQETITIKRVYYIEGLNHNLFSVGQFCDADLEVAFQNSTCYIHNFKGNDLLTCSLGTNLYSITLQDTSTPNPICLMAKATSSQAWLWHRRLSHLNFDSINLISKNNIVIGLLKLKFVKDHLCSSCELKKSKRKSFHTKTTPSSKRRLQLLHMDLCGPMRVESINVVSKTFAVNAVDAPDKRQQQNTTQSTTTTVVADIPSLNIQTTPVTTNQALTQAPIVTTVTPPNGAWTEYVSEGVTS
nr:retrovirus-related Pol polyprotein from transposon TNT 1-94 [Tanacetum cinerariifolium]